MIHPTQPFSRDRSERLPCLLKTFSPVAATICLVAGAIILSLAACKAFGPTRSMGFSCGITSGCCLVYASITFFVVLASIHCKKKSQHFLPAPRVLPNSAITHPSPRHATPGFKNFLPFLHRSRPKLTEFKLFQELPVELQEHILFSAPFGALTNSLSVSKQYCEVGQGAVIQKARSFGYKGPNFEGARKYLKTFLKCIRTYSHDIDNPQFQTRCTSAEEAEYRAVRLQKLTVEEIYSFYTTIHQYEIDVCSPLTTYLLKLVEERVITGNVSPKTTVHPLLITASQQGNISLLKLLLKIGANPNLEKDGIFPLHWAAKNRHHEAVNVLLEHEASVNALCSEGRTALGRALSCILKRPRENSGNVAKTVQILLEKGANPTLASIEEGAPSPLYLSILNKEAFTLLFEHREQVELNATELHALLYACIEHADSEDEILEQVHTLLQRGADPNLRSQTGETVLRLAAKKGFAQVINILLAYKAKVDDLGRKGKTPLYTLLENAEDENKVLGVVSHLLYNGADPAQHTSGGDTALHLAARKGFIEILSAMLKKNLNPDVQNAQGQTLLYLLMKNFLFEEEILLIVNELLQQGANPNIPTQEGDLPLNVAAGKGWNQMVSLLLSHGADANAGQNTNFIPLASVLHSPISEARKFEILTLLLEKGRANPDQLFKGATPLFYALLFKYKKIAELLIQSGADLNAPDSDNETVLIKILKERRLTNKTKEKYAVKLIAHGASLDIRSSQGETLYHLAVAIDSLDLLELLYSKVPTLIGAPDSEGVIPLDWADPENQKEIAEFLAQKTPLTIFSRLTRAFKMGFFSK